MKIEAIGKTPGCKLLRISAEISGPPGADSTIFSLSIRGDFFAVPEEAFEALEARLAGTKISEIGSVFDALAEKMRIQTVGVSGAGIQSVIQGAIDGLSIQGPADRL